MANKSIGLRRAAPQVSDSILWHIRYRSTMRIFGEVPFNTGGHPISVLTFHDDDKWILFTRPDLRNKIEFPKKS